MEKRERGIIEIGYIGDAALRRYSHLCLRYLEPHLNLLRLDS